tara:strand:- start:100 stop:960 length:861 start_codon:yes stop_codon:yes gene_type:complete
MSVNVTTSFVEQYSANVQMLSQQMGSLLRGAVDVESIKGKNAFFEQIGSVTAQVRTSRHGATPQIDTPHSRRRLNTATYEWADLIDDADKIRMLIDPTSSYAKAAAAAMGRAMDTVIITAALGTAYTGVSGGTSTSLPSGQKIAHGSAGLTVAKLLSAKKILDQNNIDPSVKRWCVVSPEQVEDLLNTTEVKSSDYNTVKALAMGDINSFLGFSFITSNLLTQDATPNRQVIAFAADGIKLGIGKDITAKISERDDKSYSTQVYYSMDLGSTRMEEEKIVEIACVE